MKVLIALLLCATPLEAATLYVNNSGSPSCSDATAKASNTALAPWCTVGRAVWGNANRATPSAAEAADDDDVVRITAGTYDSQAVVNDPLGMLYNPANEGGSSTDYITFQAMGIVILTAPLSLSPIIGADAKDYIKWYADRSTGAYFYLLACGIGTGQPNTCPSNTVANQSDTGPIACFVNAAGCWIEGVTAVGYAPIDYADNWSAVRWNNTTTPVVRNSVFSNFTRSAGAGGTNHNQTCITYYGASDGLFEHNTCDTTGAGAFAKDTGTTQTQQGNIFRLNLFTNLQECFAFSEVTAGSTEGGSDYTQNVCSGGLLQAVHLSGDADAGSQNHQITNNTFYAATQACLYVTLGTTNIDGIEFHSNICWASTTGTGGAGRQIAYQSGNVVPAVNISTQHNLYYLFAQFATDGTGNLTFAAYKAAAVPNDDTAPDSVAGLTSAENPLFANAAGSDFRLCTAAGVPVVGCTGASPAVALGPAGAYITNLECIGLESACVAVATPNWGRLRGVEQ